MSSQHSKAAVSVGISSNLNFIEPLIGCLLPRWQKIPQYDCLKNLYLNIRKESLNPVTPSVIPESQPYYPPRFFHKIPDNSILIHYFNHKRIYNMKKNYKCVGHFFVYQLSRTVECISGIVFFRAAAAAIQIHCYAYTFPHATY